MQVALAFSFASDLEPLQDFGFECRAQSLYLSQAAGPDGVLQFDEGGHPKLLVQLEHFVWTQARNREQLQDALRHFLAHTLQRGVRSGPVQPLDDAGDRVANTGNIMQAVLRDYLLQG